jgi:ribonuclease HI
MTYFPNCQPIEEHHSLDRVGHIENKLRWVFMILVPLKGSHATVFQSEVHAILASSEYCVSEGIVNRAISICSNSSAALLAFKLYAVSSRVLLQCKDSLQELVLSNRVRLVWVLGHCGIHGNEEANALARAGSSSTFVEPELCLPLAPSSVKRRERVT